MFDELFEKCIPVNEEKTSPESDEKIRKILAEKINTPLQIKEDKLMKHISISKTIISAAAVAALGALSMVGASADNISDITYKSADGKDLGAVAYQFSSDNAIISDVGTVDIGAGTITIDGETQPISVNKLVDGVVINYVADGTDPGNTVLQINSDDVTNVTTKGIELGSMKYNEDGLGGYTLTNADGEVINVTVNADGSTDINAEINYLYYEF